MFTVAGVVAVLPEILFGLLGISSAWWVMRHWW